MSKSKTQKQLEAKLREASSRLQAIADDIRIMRRQQDYSTQELRELYRKQDHAKSYYENVKGVVLMFGQNPNDEFVKFRVSSLLSGKIPF